MKTLTLFPKALTVVPNNKKNTQLRAVLIMKRFVATLVLPAFLLACGGGSNPFEPDPEPPTSGDPGAEDVNPETGIPNSLANDVTRITYVPGSATLTVEGVTLDDVPFTSIYQRRPALDRNGYEAYTAQDDALDRHNTAFARQSANDAAVRAGVVVSGGPRNRFFGGGYYERDGAYTPPAVSPTSGLVSYAGTYVGLTNLNGDGGDLITPPGGTPPELIPSQAAEVTGDVFINADFADNAVEGNIYNRQLADSGLVLPAIVLISTEIKGDGTFYGTEVEWDQGAFPADSVIGTDIGDYGGIFGGQNASGIAGVIHLTQFDGPNDPLSLENEEEYGVFVLDQCGQPVDDPICAGVNP